MPPNQDVDTSRTAVKTYVPTYQKEVWQEHADRLDMTQSEFLRTMVQAGRRDFSLDGGGSASDDTSADGTAAGLAEVVLDILDESEFRSWDELLEGVTEDVEAQLEDVIGELQDDNRIRHSGKEDGYILVDS